MIGALFELAKLGVHGVRALNGIANDEKRSVMWEPSAALQGAPQALIIDGAVTQERVDDVAEGALIAKDSVVATALEGRTVLMFSAPVETQAAETLARVLSLQAGFDAFALSKLNERERWVRFCDGTQKETGGAWAKLEKRLKLPAGTLQST